MHHRLYVEKIENPPIELIGLTMSRAGNTAIGHWLLQQFTGGVRDDTLWPQGSWATRNSWNKERPVFDHMECCDYQSIDSIVSNSFPTHANHKVIRNLENFSFKDIKKSKCKDILERISTPIDLRFLLIIRDPYNWFASRIFKAKGNNKLFRALIEVWKDQARMCDKMKLFGRPFVVIKYNEWAVSEEYRKRIAMRVCDKYTYSLTDIRYNKSRFHGKHPCINPQVAFSRWEYAADECKNYKVLIGDEEIEYLSNKIFNYPKPF